jgi:3-methylcrotonyl-CoA carboxylase alpha subunit
LAGRHVNARSVFRHGEREWIVEPQEGHLAIDGTVLSHVRAGRDTWRLERSDGTAREAFAVAQGDQCWVHVEGRVYVFERDAGGGVSRRRAGTDAGLSAPMPATVRTLLVSDGQSVRAGDTLVVLEAMKMELPVRAPRDGIVTGIHCREGELVQPGTPLVDVT